MMKLYLDVDGVLFGKYSDPPMMQLRPGVNSFLHWCYKRFDIMFLTVWEEEDLIQLFQLLYLRGLPTVRCCNWKKLKTEAIDWSRPFLWVEDYLLEKEKKELVVRDRFSSWIQVSGNGRDELERIRSALEQRIVVASGG